MALVTVGQIPENDYSSYDALLDSPHLYKSLNDDFSTPGLTLSDALSCTALGQIMEYPTLQMTYPRDGVHAIEIQKDRYIMADFNRKFVHQIFKITHVQQELDQIIVSAEHIGATLNDSTVPGSIQFANATAQDVMNQVFNTMQPGRDFEFHSDVDKLSNVNIEKGQQAGAILINPDQEGDQAVNSIPGLFGGDDCHGHQPGHAAHCRLQLRGKALPPCDKSAENNHIRSHHRDYYRLPRRHVRPGIGGGSVHFRPRTDRLVRERASHHHHLLPHRRLPDGDIQFLPEHRHGKQGHFPFAHAANAFLVALPACPSALLGCMGRVGEHAGV